MAMAMFDRGRMQEELDAANRRIQELTMMKQEQDNLVVRLRGERSEWRGQCAALEKQNAYWQQRDTAVRSTSPAPQLMCACGSLPSDLSREFDCEEDRQVMTVIGTKNARIQREHNEAVEEMKQQIRQLESERNKALRSLSDANYLLDQTQQGKKRVETLLKDEQRQKQEDEQRMRNEFDSERHRFQVVIDDLREANNKDTEMANQKVAQLEDAEARIWELEEKQAILENNLLAAQQSEFAYLIGVDHTHQKRIQYLESKLPNVKSDVNSDLGSSEEPGRKRVRVN